MIDENRIRLSNFVLSSGVVGSGLGVWTDLSQIRRLCGVRWISLLVGVDGRWLNVGILNWCGWINL